jgi:hypothetical protein
VPKSLLGETLRHSHRLGPFRPGVKDVAGGRPFPIRS